jgi:LacI family transcriptional regulator
MNPEWIVEVESDYPEKKVLNWEDHYDYVASKIKGGVTAWMCPSDLAGYELYKGLTRRGFSIPRDVSITGFDSNPSEGMAVLTSMKLKSIEMGAIALRILTMSNSDSELPRQAMKLDCDLVEGETVGPAFHMP